jgi:hypothetical protein
MKHFLITRYNLGAPDDVEGLLAKRGIDFDEWMTHRTDIFEQFVVPSVKNQTCQNFTWIIFLDSRTPLEYKSRLTSILSGMSNVDVVDVEFKKEQIHGELLFTSSYINSLIKKKREVIITTHLDSDDLLSNNFVRKVQQHTFNMDTPYFIEVNLVYRLEDTLENWASPTINVRRIRNNNLSFYISGFGSLVEQQRHYKTKITKKHLRDLYGLEVERFPRRIPFHLDNWLTKIVPKHHIATIRAFPHGHLRLVTPGIIYIDAAGCQMIHKFNTSISMSEKEAKPVKDRDLKRLQGIFGFNVR